MIAVGVPHEQPDEQETKSRVARLSSTGKLGGCRTDRVFQRVLSGSDPKPRGPGVPVYAVPSNVCGPRQLGTGRSFTGWRFHRKSGSAGRLAQRRPSFGDTLHSVYLSSNSIMPWAKALPIL